MARDLGTKYVCFKCGTKFYDLKKPVPACPKCGTEKIYFVQHTHGNYPVLDYVCPDCDLGGEYQVDWDKGGEKVKDE